MQDMSLAKASLEMFGKIIYLVLFHFCLHLSELVDLQMRVESLKSDKKRKTCSVISEMASWFFFFRLARVDSFAKKSLEFNKGF